MRAALNRLKEERLRVVEARSRLLDDLAVEVMHAGHRRAMLRQMADELVELNQAIALIEQMTAAGCARTSAASREAAGKAARRQALKLRPLTYSAERVVA